MVRRDIKTISSGAGCTARLYSHYRLYNDGLLDRVAIAKMTQELDWSFAWPCICQGYCELLVSFSWGNVCILVVVEGYLSMCYQ